MANDRDGHSVKPRKPANDRVIVSIATITVHLNEVVKQSFEEVQRIRPLGVTGEAEQRMCQRQIGDPCGFVPPAHRKTRQFLKIVAAVARAVPPQSLDSCQ